MLRDSLGKRSFKLGTCEMIAKHVMSFLDLRGWNLASKIKERSANFYKSLYKDEGVVDDTLDRADIGCREWLRLASHRKHRFSIRGTKHEDFVESFAKEQ